MITTIASQVALVVLMVSMAGTTHGSVLTIFIIATMVGTILGMIHGLVLGTILGMLGMIHGLVHGMVLGTTGITGMVGTTHGTSVLSILVAVDILLTAHIQAEELQQEQVIMVVALVHHQAMMWQDVTV